MYFADVETIYKLGLSMQEVTKEAESSWFTQRSIGIIVNKIASMTGSICVLSKSMMPNNFNITGLKYAIDRLQMIEDTQTSTLHNNTVESYTVPVLGPQGAVVPITKYLPTLSEPIKKALLAVIKGQFNEYKKLEVDKLIGSAALELLLSLHDTFAFLEDFNARDTKFMRSTLSTNSTNTIRKHINDEITFTTAVDNAKVEYDIIRTNDVSINCKDTILLMTISVLVNDNRTCWFRPIQVHSSSEIRHSTQTLPKNSYIHYLGDNLIRAGNSLLAQVPYIKVLSGVNCPIYIRDIDAFLWTAENVTVKVSCGANKKYEQVITKGMLIYPTVDCSMISEDIIIDKVKVYKQTESRVLVEKDLPEMFILQTDSVISTLVNEKVELLRKVAANFQYAFDSEIQLRNRVYALETPWYIKLQNLLITLGAAVAMIVILLILIKCGILGLLVEICQCCIKCMNIKNNKEHESIELTSNENAHDNLNFEQSEDTKVTNLEKANENIYRKKTPVHMKNVETDCPSCLDVVQNGRPSGRNCCSLCKKKWTKHKK